MTQIIQKQHSTDSSVPNEQDRACMQGCGHMPRELELQCGQDARKDNGNCRERDKVLKGKLLKDGITP